MGDVLRVRCATCFLVLAFSLPRPAWPGDWPMLGRDGTRNAVTSETGAPSNWCVEQRGKEGRLIRGARGVRWSAPLGWSTFSSPVVSSGLVWIGTNYSGPEANRDRREGFLKCFRASDGKLLYELNSPAVAMDLATVHGGISSSPLIEGDRLWVVTNRSEVLCLDIGPLTGGDGQPRQIWKLDMVAELEIFQRSALMGPPRNCSIGPSWNNHIFVTTNNGADRSHPGPIRVPRPDAPSVVCLEKNTGKVLWKDSSPGANILTTQFASPTVAEIAGQMQVIVPQGDGWVRSFDPETGQKLWEFDVNFKDSTFGPFGSNSTRNDLLANAVVYEDRIYICSGQEAMHGEGIGRLVCIDATKRGDISSELAADRDGKLLPPRRSTGVVPTNGEVVISNPNSGLVWEFVKSGDKFEEQIHRSMSSVVVHKGLVIAADFSGLVHCFDAKTGKRHWAHDTLAAIWASPLIADDKIYVPDEDGDVSVFRLGAEPECAEPIATVDPWTSIYSGPVYVDGTLYVASQTTLYAIDAAQARRAREQAAYWPQWRGEKRDNRSSDTGLLKSWPAEGPPLTWRADGLGDGIASLAIADGRIFTTTSYGNSEYVVALDEGTAEQLWIERVGAAVPENPLMRWLSQRTPTVDDDRVYVFTKEGWLGCLRAATGSSVWKLNYPSEFGTKQPIFGYCDRPLVDGDKLICVPGGPRATMVALNKLNGRVIWKTTLDSQEQAGYGSTIVVETEGLRQYVAVLTKGLASFAADDGRLLWRYEGTLHPVGMSTYTPLVVPDGLLVNSGYGSSVSRIKLKRGGNSVTPEESFLVRQRLDPFEDSTVIVDGRLYGFGPLPLCLSVADGATVWGPVRPQPPPLGNKAAATYADGHLYVRWTGGAVTLMQPSPKEYVEKSRFTLSEPRNSLGATFPVVAGGHLFIRDNDRLYCYDVSQQTLGVKQPEARLVALPAPRDVGPKPPEGQRIPDAIFVPTPADVVERMLALAKVGKDDVIYDLGSGDGRLLIQAAKQHGCRAVGIEIKRELCELSRERARQAEVNQLVTIREADVFESHFDDATVVAVYLFPGLLERLKPKFEQLKPGTRIISHQFAIPGATPDATETVPSSETGEQHRIYLWTVPLKTPPPKK